MTARRSQLVQTLAERVGARTCPTHSPEELEVEVGGADLAAALATLREHGGRPLTVYGSDGGESGSPRLVRYVYDLEAADLFVSVRVDLDAAGSAPFPWQVRAEPSLAWCEREVAERFAVEVSGFPELEEPGRGDGNPSVEGIGVHSFVHGPLLDGLGESSARQLAVLGERMVHVQPRLGFKRRGAESLAEGMAPARAVLLAERLCGACSLANATGLALALEKLAGTALPARAVWLRTALLELERLMAHAAGIAALCQAAGEEVGAGHALGAHEALAGAAEQAVGSRLLHGVVRPGGVRRDLDPEAGRGLVRSARSAAEQLRRLAETFLGGSFGGQISGLGVLSPDAAREAGMVGPAARASASRRDARRDHPYLAYPDVHLWVPVFVPGDAPARLRVLVEEAQQSAAVIEEVLEALPTGPLAAELAPLAAGQRALAVVESPRGATLHAVHADRDGRIGRWHVRPASHANWPALTLIAAGAPIGLLPLLEASLDLCVACADR